MSVAHDLDAADEERRKQSAQLLVRRAALELYRLRLKTMLLEAGDAVTWQEASALAQELIREGGKLELSLLVACSKEVLHFADRSTASGAADRDATFYLLSALDTLGMELERLQHDRKLR